MFVVVNNGKRRGRVNGYWQAGTVYDTGKTRTNQDKIGTPPCMKLWQRNPILVGNDRLFLPALLDV